MDNIRFEEVETFLNFLDPGAPYFAFTVLGDSGPVARGGTRIESTADALAFLGSLNGSVPGGATLHVTLNRTTSKGRKTKDIEAPRVLCIDLDRTLEKQEIKTLVEQFCAHLVVESSPGKYHVYWKLSPSIPLDTWSKWQLGLAYHFNSDRNLSQLAKNIRVPGIARTTKTGETFIPCIKYISDDITELAFDSVLTLFPWINDDYEAGLAERKENRAKINLNPKQVADSGVGRNSTVYELVKLKSSELLFWADGGDSKTSLITFTRQEALSYAESINSQFDAPLDERELQECALSGYNKGLEIRDLKLDQLAAQVAKLGKLDEPPTGQPQSPFQYDYSRGALKLDPFSDQSIVERVAQRYAGHIVTIGSRSSGLLYAFWDKQKVWLRQQGRFDVIGAMVRNCLDDTLRHPDFVTGLCAGKPSNVGRWTKHFMSNQLQANTTRTVCSLVHPKKEVTEFDRNPYWLLCGNGLLDMLTGELRGATASDYLLRSTSVIWDAGATCPWWNQFLLEIFGGNCGLVDFMQELFGYTISGLIDTQKLYIHYGSGCNGKSKVLETLAALGGDYTCRMNCNTFSKSKNSIQKEFERIGAKVEGKRVVVLDDLDTDTQWNEGFVKGLTGRTITARRLYEEERDIPNRAVVHIGCNEAPRPASENYGILRRLCIIPYSVRFKPDIAKEAEIQRMTAAEMPGILAWAVVGLRRVVDRKELFEPPEVQASVDEYEEDTFSVSEIVKQLFTVDGVGEDDWHETSDLADEVNRSLAAMGLERVSSDKLGRILSEVLGCKKSRSMVAGRRARRHQVRRLNNSSGQEIAQ